MVAPLVMLCRRDGHARTTAAESPAWTHHTGVLRGNVFPAVNN
jgi:hypothetical protein